MSHALDRLRERYDPGFNREDLAAIARLIENGAVRPRHRGARGSDTAIYLVPYAGRRLKVIYSEKHRKIVTVIPLKGSRPRAKTVVREGRRYQLHG